MNNKAKLNSKRIEGRHIKHGANTRKLLKVEGETTFLVKSSSPFIGAVKRVQRILDRFDKSIHKSLKHQGGEYKKVKYVVIKGMGKAMEKTLSIGLKFQDELKYKVDIVTGTVEVLDEFKPGPSSGNVQDHDDYYNDSIYQKRKVSLVEIRVWLKRDSFV